jgi:poly(A) polymerase
MESKALSILTVVNDFLTELNVKSYIVGGFVRDVLLCRDTADIDIAIDSDALEVSSKLAVELNGRYVPLDEVNKVGRVVLSGGAWSSLGKQWHLDISTIEDDIEKDLGRRDFAINAMAVAINTIISHQFSVGAIKSDIKPVGLIDPFDGWEDMKRGSVRVVSAAAFETDSARLLRAVRLAVDLGFTIDGYTASIIRHNSHLITGVAGERIREEFLRLLSPIGTQELLLYLDELGLLTNIIPELARTKDSAQPKEHFWDVFHHTVRAVAAIDFLLRRDKWEYVDEKVLSVVPWSPMLAQHFEQEVSHGSTRRIIMKLAALLHDIAKPLTKTIETDGRMRFLGHAGAGATMASDIMKRMRFSAKEIGLVEIMVKYHLRPVQMGQGIYPTDRAIYRYFRDTADAGIDILFLSLADHLATRGPDLDLGGWREHSHVVEYVLAKRFEQENLVVSPKLVSGHDLLDTFGLSPGPKVGEILESVREAQVAGEVITREDALAFVRKELLKKK